MDPKKMMGFDVPGDQRVPVPARDWNAMKLALWRSKVALDIAAHAAAELVARSAHMEGCPGKEIETEPCLPDCPDRELRMSALVILNAARQFAPVNARQPANAPYYAPSREYFSEVMAELAVAQAELEVLRGVKVTEPPALAAAKIPPQLKEALP
jgi:hypothetical protein